MGKWLHSDDITIDRDDLSTVVVFDGDGEQRATFPGDWTDKQIVTAIELANRAFNDGIRCGENSKINEIKRVLKID